MAGEGRRGSTNRVVVRILDLEIRQTLILLECFAMIEEAMARHSG